MSSVFESAPAAIAPPGSSGETDRTGRTEIIRKYPLNALTVRPQVRRHFDERALAGLAQSIAEQGLLYPVLCYRDRDKLVLIDGERRWRAASMAGLKEIPARVLENPLTITEALARQLTCNLQNEPLSLVERAEGIASFMRDARLNGKEAAQQLGMEPSALTRALGILKLPAVMRDRVTSGEISADAAYLLSRVADPAVRSILADRVAAGELTRDRLAVEVRRIESGKSPCIRGAVAQPSGPARRSEGTAASTPVATWRMTRTIGPGVSLAVSGASESLGDLLTVLEQFIARGREACDRGIRLPKFLADFKQSLTNGKAAPEVPA